MTDIASSGCNALRANNAMLGSGSEVVDIDFHGRVIKARKGESLLAALVASGEYRLRETGDGQVRGPFCGMGVCQECLVEINDAPAQRACMFKVDQPLTVRRQTPQVRAPVEAAPPITAQSSRSRAALTPQIAVVGGGPAGMAAAACAARAGADVLLIDERAQLGGQFYKQPLAANDLSVPDFDDRQFRGGRQLIAGLEGSDAKIMQPAKVVGAYEPLDLVVSLDNETVLIRPQVLIVATGAYEICQPFAGWTLPGVMTTGAAQTLLRSYRVLPGRRVLVAGNGPLNFQVAAELAGSGADVVAVIEAAGKPSVASIGSLAKMMASDPGLALKGAGYLSSLRRHGASLIYGQAIARVDAIGDAGGSGLRVSLSPGLENVRQFDVDAVCLGYGFRPSNEILRALGCRHDADPLTGALQTVRDQNCLTSRKDVLAVGDCTGLRGAPTAEAEGVLAAVAALSRLEIKMPDDLLNEAASLTAARRRFGRFQKALWQLFEPGNPLPGHVEQDTIVCRCENLTLAEVQQAMGRNGQETMASLKRSTRAGMGRCQGRYCGPFIARQLAATNGRSIEEADLWAPRPPIKPVRVSELARLDFPD
ncbi:MAG: FAD-dependent oxidoreductase [Rhizobiales bacterium]|nr:FAD-dependent oxidoreductase [Hyphomicrobiales bacterium]